MKKTKILIPLDGSSSSLISFNAAKQVAQILNMAIHILYVSDIQLTQQELIKELKLSDEESSGCVLTQKIGIAHEEILNEVEKHSLMIISTHGKTNNHNKILGTTTKKVIENTTTPTLLIKPSFASIFNGKKWAPKRALIPINGTPGSEQALKFCIDILKEYGTILDILHITKLKGSLPIERGCLTTPYYTDYPQHEWSSWVKEFFKRFCNTKENIKLNIKLSKGEPATEIIGHAKLNQNDLIAMAWHGKIGEFKAAVLQKVISEVKCPILLVKIK